MVQISWFLNPKGFCSLVNFITLFNIRCSCNRCNNELLESAREFSCCREVLPAVGKLNFEGIEARCVTEHPDFATLTNNTVLVRSDPFCEERQEGGTTILQPVPRMLKMSKRDFSLFVYVCAVACTCTCHLISVHEHLHVFLCRIPEAFNFPLV